MEDLPSLKETKDFLRSCRKKYTTMRLIAWLILVMLVACVAIGGLIMVFDALVKVAFGV